MKLTLTIELGNDAMKSMDDLAGALEKTAGKLRDYDKPILGETGRIIDTNGNVAGRWCLTR